MPAVRYYGDETGFLIKRSAEKAETRTLDEDTRLSDADPDRIG